MQYTLCSEARGKAPGREEERKPNRSRDITSTGRRVARCRCAEQQQAAHATRLPPNPAFAPRRTHVLNSTPTMARAKPPVLVPLSPGTKRQLSRLPLESLQKLTTTWLEHPAVYAPDPTDPDDPDITTPLPDLLALYTSFTKPRLITDRLTAYEWRTGMPLLAIAEIEVECTSSPLPATPRLTNPAQSPNNPPPHAEMAIPPPHAVHPRAQTPRLQPPHLHNPSHRAHEISVHPHTHTHPRAPLTTITTHADNAGGEGYVPRDSKWG